MVQAVGGSSPLAHPQELEERVERAAERRSQEVTERVLATAPPETSAPPAPGPPPPAGPPATATAPGGSGLADPLAALVQIGALLGP